MRRSAGDEAGDGEGLSAGGQSAEGSLYFLPDNLIADEVAPSQDSQLGLETHATIPSPRTYSGPKETTEQLGRLRLPPPRPLPSLQPQPQPQPQHQQHQQQHQQQQQQLQQHQQHQKQHVLPLQQSQHQQLRNKNHHLLMPTTELQDASTPGLPSLDATAYLGQQQEHHVQQPNLFEMGAVFRPIATVPPGGDQDQHAAPNFGGFLGHEQEQSLQQQPQLDQHGHVMLEEEEPRSRRSSNVLELLSEAMPDHHLRAPFVTGTESSLRPTAQDFEPQFARAESPLLSQTQFGASSAWQGTPFTFVPTSETQDGRTPSPPAPEQATSLRRSPANYFRSAKSLVSGAFQSNIFSPRSSYLGGSTDNGAFGDGFHVSVDTTANVPSQQKSPELESSQSANASSTGTSMPALSASGTSFSPPRKASASFFPWRDVGTKGSVGSDQDVRPRTSPSPVPGAGTGASSSWPNPPVGPGSPAHKSTSESTLPVMPNTKQTEGRPTRPPRTQTSSSLASTGRENGRSTPEPLKMRGASRGDSVAPSGRSSGNATRQSSRNGRRHTAQGTPGYSGQTRSSRHPHLRRRDSPQSLNSDPSEALSSAQASPRGRQRQHSADSAFSFGHGNTGKNRKARGGGASRRERQDSEPRVTRSKTWTVNESPSKSRAAGSSLGEKPHHHHPHSFAVDVAKHEEAANENVWAVLDSNDDEAAPELDENDMVPSDDVGATDVESEKSKALPNTSSAAAAKGDKTDILPPAKITLAGVNAAPSASSQPSLDEPGPANTDKKLGSGGRRSRSRKRSSTHVPAASSHATKVSADRNAANGTSLDAQSANDSTSRRRVAHSADVRDANNKESSSLHDKTQGTSFPRKETRQVEEKEKLAPARSQENLDGTSINLWQRVCEIGAFTQGRVVELYEIGILGTRASAHAGMQGAKYVCSHVIGCHQRAASGILESGEGFHVMVCYIFLQAFAPFATTVLASTAPWAHICLWYAFLAQYLCLNETRRATIFQFVLPVFFVLEGVSRPSYLLVLAPAELLMLAFCILILRDDRLRFNLRLLMTVSGHIIMALTVGDYFLVQWFLVVSQLDFLASTSLRKLVSPP